jgi:AcrR family transcriptional regulator
VSQPLTPFSAGTNARQRRRRLSAAARRQTILDAAIPLFASVGYEQTRMADVAARVGVTEPVIFQNFGTKAELFSAVLERISDDASRYLTALVEQCLSVHDWLRHLLAAEHLDHLHTAPMFGVLIAEAHRARLEPAVHAALHRGVSRAAESISAILLRGQAERSIRDDASPDALAWLVVSLIQARQFRRTHAATPAPALERDLAEAILDTFRPHASSPARAARPSIVRR